MRARARARPVHLLIYARRWGWRVSGMGGRGPGEKTKRQGAQSVPFTTRRYVEENQRTRECSRRHRIRRHRRRRRRNPYKRDIARTFGRLVGRSVGQSVSQSVSAAACTRKSLTYRDNIFLPMTTKVSAAAWLRKQKKLLHFNKNSTLFCPSPPTPIRVPSADLTDCTGLHGKKLIHGPQPSCRPVRCRIAATVTAVIAPAAGAPL